MSANTNICHNGVMRFGPGETAKLMDACAEACACVQTEVAPR